MLMAAVQKKEYFCPTCKKIVKEIRSEFGQLTSPGLAAAPVGELPVFICKKCLTPVMELTKSKGKRKLITEKGIVEVGE
jgi:CTP:molybdopterin cytidylyltransferase MocA